MKLTGRVEKLEARAPAEPQRVVQIISPRADMTEAECDAFIAAERGRRGLGPDDMVIFRRIVTPEGVAARDGEEAE